MQNNSNERTVPPSEAPPASEARLRALEASVEELEKRRLMLEDELARDKRELALQAGLAAQRAGEVAALRGSLSWRVTAPLRFALDALLFVPSLPGIARGVLARVGGVGGLLRAVGEVWRRGGLSALWWQTRYVLGEVTRVNPPAHLPAAANPAAADPWGEANGTDLMTKPVFSVLMPTYNTPRDMLEAAIASVRAQTYPFWELCIADDCSKAPHVREVIERHVAEDRRIRVTWREKNGNISAALNSALALASGDYMCVLDHDDLLDAKALYGLARTISDYPDTDYVYTDEDKASADGTHFYGPFYKPDWSPEYFHSLMYTCHLGAFRMSLVREIGGYRPEFDGAQDFDFTLRFLLKTQKVRHVPRVLYHWRVWEQSTAQSIDAKPEAEGRARRALEEFLVASKENFTIGPGPRPGHHAVRFLPKGEPLVSIVIPTANGTIDIHGRKEWHIDEVCRTILEKTSYRHFEIVVVHNGDLRPTQVDWLTSHKQVRLLHYKAERFSLADKINQGCDAAAGPYLVIMNDDIRVITPDWLTLLLGMVQREGVGAVGPKLLFPNGTIQHAGVVILGGCPGHAYYEWPGDSEGYAMGALVPRNVLAVTGACVITPKAVYQELGGFSPRYPLNYNDVDYCLKLHQRGLRSVFLPEAVLYHYEGVSKEGGRSVGSGELEKFLTDWADKYRHDPYYNPNLSQHAPYRF